MKRKIKKRIDGAISLLMVAILLPTMVLSGLMVDLSRYNMAKAMISSAGDLTMNAALADYDAILQDVYGLFAISQNDDELYSNLSKYFQNTLVSHGVISEADSEDYVNTLLDNITSFMVLGENNEASLTNLFDMEVLTDSPVSGAAGSTLENENILKKQIVEYMKYRAPINCAMSFFSGLSALTKSDKQANVVEAKVEAETYVKKVSDSSNSLWDAIKKYDKNLFVSKTFDVHYLDEKDPGMEWVQLDRNSTKSEELNDTSEFKNLVNREVFPAELDSKKTVYNFQVLNRFILGFFLDEVQSDPTNDGAVSKVDSTNPAYNSSISSSDDYETACNKLVSDAGAYYQSYQYLDIPEISGSTGLIYQINSFKTVELGSIDLQDSDHQAVVKAEVREKMKNGLSDDCLATYKRNFKFLRDANKPDSTYNSMVTKYCNLLKYKSVFTDSYNKVLDCLTIVENEINDIENNKIPDLNNERSNLQTNTIPDLESQIEDAENAEDEDDAEEGDEEEEEEEEEEEVDIDALKQQLQDANDRVDEIDEEISAYNNKITNDLKPKKTAYDNALTEARNSISGSGSVYESGSFTESTLQQNTQEALDNMAMIYRYYTYFVNASKEVANKLAEGIYAESSYLKEKIVKINSNLKSITALINGGKLTNDDGSVGEEVVGLKKVIENYNKKLDAWDTANKAVSADNQADQFADSMSKEIAANKEAYKWEEVEKVYNFALEQWNAIAPLCNYMTNNKSDGYNYGDKFFWEIEDLNCAIDTAKLVASSASFENKDTVTLAECDAQFKNLNNDSKQGYSYKETDTALKSFTKETDEELLPFIGYLKCTYPESEAEVSEEEKNIDGENALTLYNNTEDNLKKNNADENKSSGVDGEAEAGDTDYYKYTFKGEIPLLTSSGNEDSIDTRVDVGEEGGEKDAYETKKNASKNLLSGISDAMVTGRDNIFVMDYAFSNFSYNTIVQDAAYDNATSDEKSGFYASYLSMSDSERMEFYAPYRALTTVEKGTITTDDHEATRPQTLSGYPISEYNNQFYGAEVEYLVYGLKGSENNVKAADASIFAVRFILNSTFAFSNSEIRNITRTAGLAVQAASLGVIPYQVVMVVLQLALTMSESLLDLEVMHTGAKVAIVPTKKTWMLSPTGAGNMLKDVAASKVKSVVNTAVSAVANQVAQGIQNFVDCTAEEMESKAADLIGDLESTVVAKAEELTDDVFAQFEGSLMEELNKIRYLEQSATNTAAEQMKQAIDTAFDKADEVKDNALNHMNVEGGEVGTTIKTYLAGQMDALIGELKTQAYGVVDSVVAADPGKKVEEYATKVINQTQSKISMTITTKINTVSDQLEEETKGLISNVSTEITNLAKEKTEDAKNQIIEKTNNFIDEKVNSMTDKMPDMQGLSTTYNTVDGSGAASRTISFGYSDYLRVFFFLKLCSSGQDVMKRMAALIECNINYPNQKVQEVKESASFFEDVFKSISWFFSKKKTSTEGEGDSEADDKWYISKAYTYVQVDADIDMKMFFLDTDFFKNVLSSAYADEADTIDVSLTKTSYHYHGIMGY